MAKLQLSILLIALVALAAIITTSAYDHDNQMPPRRCRQQIQSRPLRNCEQLVTRRQGIRQIVAMELYNDDDDDDNTVMNLRECCIELRRMDDNTCSCEALKEIIRRRRQEGRLQGREMAEMVKRASSLPSACRLRQQRCDVQSAARS